MMITLNLQFFGGRGNSGTRGSGTATTTAAESITSGSVTTTSSTNSEEKNLSTLTNNFNKLKFTQEGTLEDMDNMSRLYDYMEDTPKGVTVTISNQYTADYYTKINDSTWEHKSAGMYEGPGATGRGRISADDAMESIANILSVGKHNIKVERRKKR